MISVGLGTGNGAQTSDFPSSPLHSLPPLFLFPIFLLALASPPANAEKELPVDWDADWDRGNHGILAARRKTQVAFSGRRLDYPGSRDPRLRPQSADQIREWKTAALRPCRAAFGRSGGG